MISNAWRIHTESHYLFEGEQLHIALVLSSQAQSSCVQLPDRSLHLHYTSS
jgi:hypothetical protein